jgi:arylsulfatase A
MILTHSPYQPTPGSPDYDPQAEGETVNQNPKHFADMTAYMDKLIGRLTTKLDELGIRDNTLVIFIGDNGTGVGIKTQFQGQPYPGGKGQTTARGMHVPLIVNQPGRIPAGRVCDDLVASVDFLPTICEAAGASVPESSAMDGRSFYTQLRQIRGESGSPREWYYCWYARDGGAAAEREFAATATHKLYRDGRFFRLTDDPFEMKPLKAADATAEDGEAMKRLQGVLAAYAEARPMHLRKPAPARPKGETAPAPRPKNKRNQAKEPKA